MRWAILSDVHANGRALDAALAAAERLRVDAVLCPGDLVGYGPEPNAVVRRIAREATATVAGNHDLIALGRLSDARCGRLARRSLAWTITVLEDDVRAVLAELPDVARPASHLLMAHGSPGDPQAYVDGPELANAVLADVARTDPHVRIVVLGHTHRWMAYGERRGLLPARSGRPIALDPGERTLLNAGSVGQSRERGALARFMVLDADVREASFHAVRFDVRATRRALRRAGLPAHSAHVRPGAARALAARALRAAGLRH